MTSPLPATVGRTCDHPHLPPRLTPEWIRHDVLSEGSQLVVPGTAAPVRLSRRHRCQGTAQSALRRVQFAPEARNSRCAA